MFLTLKVTTARPVQIFASAEKEKIDVGKKMSVKGFLLIFGNDCSKKKKSCVEKKHLFF